MNRTSLETEMQYQNTKTIKKGLEITLEQLKKSSLGKDQQYDPLILKASIEGYESVIKDLDWEIMDYEYRNLNDAGIFYCDSCKYLRRQVEYHPEDDLPPQCCDIEGVSLFCTHPDILIWNGEELGLEDPEINKCLLKERKEEKLA